MEMYFYILPNGKSKGWREIMFITRKFLYEVGRRSPMARMAMVQAGDRNRIKALKNFLISVGACEITYKEAENLGLEIRKKKYSFSTVCLSYVLLDAQDFDSFKPLKNSVDLEVAHIRNGLIGIRKGQRDD